MRRYTTTFLILISTIKSWSCGWWPESDLYFFYNLFDQTTISGAEYYPFLRTDDKLFYEAGGIKLANPGSLHLWEQLLPSWSVEQINQALFNTSNEEFEKIWAGKKSTIELSSKKYIAFARKCGTLFQYRHRDSWDYQEILNQNIPDASPLLEEGLILFHQEKENSLRIRYAYQLIRILHYSKQYQEAIDFFQNNVAQKFDRNELYYYALDQVGGCHYSLGNYEYAAYIFIQIFNQSLDRKKSALLSYKFCTDKGAEGKAYFESREDTIGYITIKSLRSFYDKITGIEQLMNIAPGDVRTELLFMRTLNNLERRIWPTHIGMDKKTLPYLEERDRQQIVALIRICNTQIENSTVTNKEFWWLAVSYLHFLSSDVSQARLQLDKIQKPKFQQQKEILLHTYEIFSWEHITDAEEKHLASILNEDITAQPFDQWNALAPAWRYLILDQAAHLYYRDGKLAKAFLMHNRLETIEAIGSLALIDDLLTFVQQGEKNDFEKILMRRAANLPASIPAIDYLTFIKGLYYMQHGDAKTAYPFLATSSLNHDQGSPDSLAVGKSVNATIFSNNITECFNCPDTLMKDSVYLSSVFSFIQPRFSKAELAAYLIKLDSLTHDPKLWKSKLAHYLLANYYFNVSNTGYFRGTLTGQSNCCSYRYFFSKYDHHQLAADLIPMHEGFNLLDITDHYLSDNGLAKKARAHYELVISKSNDKELNARCLYMMAKCELNAYYNSGPEFNYDGYDGTVDSDTKPYKTSFKTLKKDYTDTRFYKMIIKECSFFRYYCAL
jgi:hypothetical protein